MINKYKLDIRIHIMKDNQDKFLIEKRRFRILKNQINKIIKKHYNKLLQSYFGINKILQIF